MGIAPTINIFTSRSCATTASIIVCDIKCYFETLDSILISHDGWGNESKCPLMNKSPYWHLCVNLISILIMHIICSLTAVTVFQVKKILCLCLWFIYSSYLSIMIGYIRLYTNIHTFLWPGSGKEDCGVELRAIYRVEVESGERSAMTSQSWSSLSTLRCGKRY